MISRRNIRVKVMQSLYVMASAEQVNLQKETDSLHKKFLKTRELIVFLLKTVIDVAQYAEKDAVQRSGKHITTEADLTVNTKIAGNKMLWQIIESKSYQAALAELNPGFPEDFDIVKKLYLQMVESEMYKYYIASAEREKAKESEMLCDILSHIIFPNEVFTSYMEEKFANWDDDIDMVETILHSYFKRPSSLHIDAMLGDDKWSFAKDLLRTVTDKKEHINEYLLPKFKNWDPERIASLDMILLQMGLAELLYFETIPTKVTINEYIDLAKAYSTQQSGQFINGILDNLHKELIEKGKINKVDFKKK